MKQDVPVVVNVLVRFFGNDLVSCVTLLHISQGKKNPGTDRQSVISFLEQVRKAKEMLIDRSNSTNLHNFLI